MIAIVQGCGANIASVQFALARLGAKSVLTQDATQIKRASCVILPGVGTASYAMQQLRQTKLDEVIADLRQPVLGICLGMQILYAVSAEEEIPCLGVLAGKVVSLQRTNLIVPHMGWNRVQLCQPNNPLLAKINNNSQVYFVHSYAAPINQHTVATTLYGENFSAVVQQDNFYGVQFHPERSGEIGAQILRNFLALR
jgi:glutamine amidotransferase